MALPHPDVPLGDTTVILRPWEWRDLPLLEEASRDAYIVETTTVPPVYTEQTGRAWIERQRSRATEEHGWSFAIAERAADEAAGAAVLMLAPRCGTANLGYWIIERARGRKLAQRSVQLFSRWALTDAGIARVEATVEPWNVASQRVLERSGFSREGVLRSYLCFPGRRADAYIYSLLATDLR